MSKQRLHVVPRSLDDIKRGALLGFSGNSKQRKQRMRALRRLGLTVETPAIVRITGTPAGDVDVSGTALCGSGQRLVKLPK